MGNIGTADVYTFGAIRTHQQRTAIAFEQGNDPMNTLYICLLSSPVSFNAIPIGIPTLYHGQSLMHANAYLCVYHPDINYYEAIIRITSDICPGTSIISI